MQHMQRCTHALLHKTTCFMPQWHKCCTHRSIVRDLWGTEVVVCTLRGTLRVTNVRGNIKNTATGRENPPRMPASHIHTHTHTHTHTYMQSSKTPTNTHTLLLTHTCLTPWPCLCWPWHTCTAICLLWKDSKWESIRFGSTTFCVCLKESKENHRQGEKRDVTSQQSGEVVWSEFEDCEFKKTLAKGKWPMQWHNKWFPLRVGFAVVQTAHIELQQIVYTTRIWIFNKSCRAISSIQYWETDREGGRWRNRPTFLQCRPGLGQMHIQSCKIFFSEPVCLKREEGWKKKREHPCNKAGKPDCNRGVEKTKQGVRKAARWEMKNCHSAGVL